MGNLISLAKQLISKNEMRILMIGLDSAGKTSILYKLKLDEMVTTIPTLGFNVECVQHKNVKFTMWDVGGQERIRSLWMYYLHGTHGLVFVVDCNDRDRIAEARFEMQHILQQEELKKTVLLVLANKQVASHSEIQEWHNIFGYSRCANSIRAMILHFFEELDFG